jgi:hypothetical protein
MHRPAPIPTNDVQRVAFLHSLNILDTQAEKAFDRITEAASTITHSPIALVSLVDSDRQWFKSRVGLDVSETSRDLAFCAHVIAQRGNGMFVVNDALEDERFKYSDLVLGEPRIRFYAAVPLVVHDGQGIEYKIGTLCIIDRETRGLEDYHCVVMQKLAELVVSEISKLRTPALMARPTSQAANAAHDCLPSWSEEWPAAARRASMVEDATASLPVGNLSPTEAEALWRNLLRCPLSAPMRLERLWELRGEGRGGFGALGLGWPCDEESDGSLSGDGESVSDSGASRMECDED